ncbi:MAG: ParB/RepB/Spo0J family partition protein [Dehalococcoidales bacterium]|nr:ParB/RepB/Spo0J family partition protein [Dehalococcoidales bacterium]
MKRYISLPTKELVSDVPVDPVHTKELADSIKTKGQLAPVIIREETREIIDGFHRVAALEELGFDHVECVLTPCDDEGFWDFRIIQASLHKNVSFARAIDWIERVFELSPFASHYKSAYTLFSSVLEGKASKDAEIWAQDKGRLWGLSLSTIEQWLYTQQSLAKDLLAKAKEKVDKQPPTVTHYINIATELPGKFDLQRKLAEKAEKEDLTTSQVRMVARAIKGAADEEEAQGILRQPVTRTEEQIIRDARLVRLLGREREITPLEKYQEAKEKDVLYKLDLLGIINSSKAMTQEKIDVLTPAQKADLYNTCEEAVAEIKRVMEMIKPSVEVKYQLKEG